MVEERTMETSGGHRQLVSGPRMRTGGYVAASGGFKSPTTNQ